MAKKPNQARLEELEDIKAVMNLPAGFRFMRRLINITGPYRSTFDADQARMSFLEGNRNFGCRMVVDLLEACPDQYVRLLIESNSNQKQEATNVHKTDRSDEETAD